MKISFKLFRQNRTSRKSSNNKYNFSNIYVKISRFSFFLDRFDIQRDTIFVKLCWIEFQNLFAKQNKLWYREKFVKEKLMLRRWFRGIVLF